MADSTNPVPTQGPPMRSGVAYLVIVPDRSDRRALRIGRVTQNPPRDLPANAVITKLRVTMPGSAFEPYVPAVEVFIDDDGIWRAEPVEVRGEQPGPITPTEWEPPK